MAKTKNPAAQTNDQTPPTTEKKRSRGNFPHVILKNVTALVRTNPSTDPDVEADWTDPVEAFVLIDSGPLKDNLAGRKYIESTFDDGEYQVVQIKSTAKVETETVKKKVLK